MIHGETTERNNNKNEIMHVLKVKYTCHSGTAVRPVQVSNRQMSWIGRLVV